MKKNIKFIATMLAMNIISKELRKDVSEMHALLKKFTKKSRLFTVEKGEAEDNDQPSA